MGDSYEKLQKLRKSVIAYQKSLMYDIKPITYYALANLYDFELKNKFLAIRYYKKYLKSNPSEKQKSYTTYTNKRITELSP